MLYKSNFSTTVFVKRMIFIILLNKFMCGFYGKERFAKGKCKGY